MSHLAASRLVDSEVQPENSERAVFPGRDGGKGK
jgi:hypothetical protein